MTLDLAGTSTFDGLIDVSHFTDTLGLDLVHTYLDVPAFWWILWRVDIFLRAIVLFSFMQVMHTDDSISSSSSYIIQASFDRTDRLMVTGLEAVNSQAEAFHALLEIMAVVNVICIQRRERGAEPWGWDVAAV